MASPARTPEFGETWVYESIISALPGIEVSRPMAITIQLGLFQIAVVVFAAYYGLWNAAIAGTAAVLVAAIGSIEMLRISTLTRAVPLPASYRRLLFGSSVEVVLAVLAYIALITHLFVFDPQARAVPLIDRLFGQEPPILVVYLTLLVLWDVCYRIGTNWWAAVTALWRSASFRFEGDTVRTLIRADLETMAFGLLQLILVPFVGDHPVLLAALVAHVAAATAVTGLSALLLWTRRTNR